MEKEPAHSLNIELSREIKEMLKSEQEKLSAKFNERRFYDSSPHLAIATKFMGEGETGGFVEALKNEFKGIATFEIEFYDFKVSDTGDYVFLHLNPNSERKIIDFHDRAFLATKNVGSEIQTVGKFANKRVVRQYNPHISIIKLDKEEIGGALSIIKSDFSGIKMPVSCFEITRQTDDERGFSNFPIIEKIKLY